METKTKILIAILLIIVAQFYLMNYNLEKYEEDMEKLPDRYVVCPNGSIEEYNNSRLLFCDGLLIIDNVPIEKDKYINEGMEKNLWRFLLNQSQNGVK